MPIAQAIELLTQRAQSVLENEPSTLRYQIQVNTKGGSEEIITVEQYGLTSFCYFAVSR